jgi:hypothetical protein
MVTILGSAAQSTVSLATFRALLKVVLKLVVALEIRAAVRALHDTFLVHTLFVAG